MRVVIYNRNEDDEIFDFEDVERIAASQHWLLLTFADGDRTMIPVSKFDSVDIQEDEG